MSKKIKGIAVGNTYVILNGIENITRSKDYVFLKYKGNERGIFLDPSEIDNKPYIDVNYGHMVVSSKSKAGILVDKILKELKSK